MTGRELIHCSACGTQTSITAGTIFQGTRKPLLLWFHIIWWIVAQKTGASAYNLMDFMGFGSYETAWAWLHKLRRAMIRPGRDKLIDEFSQYNISVLDSMRVGVNYLITDSPDSGSKKNQMAQQLGIERISENLFRRKFLGEKT